MVDYELVSSLLGSLLSLSLPADDASSWTIYIDPPHVHASGLSLLHAKRTFNAMLLFAYV